MSGKKRSDPIDSSSGEEDGDEGTSSEEDEVESPTKPAVKNPESLLDKTHDVSNSESESEDEKETPTKNPVAKPITAKKGQSSTKKRPCSESASKDAKKVKRVSGEGEKKSSGGGGGEETKKTSFERVWSEDDEVALLQKIVDYKTDNGVSPLDDTNAFYELVKSFISFDVSKNQFTKKLRSLKKKFENKFGKCKNGGEPTFSKAHDRKVFNLAKLIWGVNGIATAESNGKSKKMSREVESVKQHSLAADEPSFLVKSLARFGMDDLAAQHGWTLLASEDKRRFEEQWKSMHLREFEFYSDKSGFLHEVVTKIAQALGRKP